MRKEKNKDKRATVEAARKTSRSYIIVGIIGASALIIVAIIGKFDTKNRIQEIKYKKAEINDTLKNTDTVKNFEIRIKPDDNKERNVYKSEQTDHLYELKSIENLINYQQYSQAYRAYLKLYNSLPLSLKNEIIEKKIKKAEEKYQLGKWQEAALLMKENIENMIKD